MNKYAIYLRKSRADIEAEAHGEGETLARHEKTLMDFAYRNNLNIGKVYREVVSGETIAARPEVQQLLSDVEDGRWTGVLAMEIERLARGDTMDQGYIAQVFKYSDTLIITPNKTYNPRNEFDEEYLEFGLFMSRREYKTITRRMQQGRRASARDGKWYASIAPYGYLRERLQDQKGFTLVPHPEEAPIVQLIYKSYIEGFGVGEIAKRLNTMGVKPRKSDRWTQPTLLNILQNVVYIGKIKYKWRPVIKTMQQGQVQITRPRSEDVEIYPGLHEPLITQSDYNLAQSKRLEFPRMPIPARHVLRSPLAGLVICSECERKMRRHPEPKAADRLTCSTMGCPTVGTPLVNVERRVLEALAQWAQSYQVKVEPEPLKEVPLSDDMLSAAQKELTALRSQLATAQDLVERGVYTIEEFMSRRSALSDRIAQQEENIVTLSAALESIKSQKNQRSQLIPRVLQVIEAYDKLPTAEAKNSALKEILDRIIYTKIPPTGDGRNTPDPEGFEIVIYPKIPHN